ncbi:twin-arginine translocation signal domain-containing protein, partial [Petrimonas sulfuriphila]
MQLNRRSFLKIAGAAGVGSMLTGKLTGSELPPQQQPPAKQLKSIYLEAYKKHPQRFNMCGYAAPKIDTVRVAFIGVGARGSAAVERVSYIDGV